MLFSFLRTRRTLRITGVVQDFIILFSLTFWHLIVITKSATEKLMTSLSSDLHKNYQRHKIQIYACILLGNLYYRSIYIINYRRNPKLTANFFSFASSTHTRVWLDLVGTVFYDTWCIHTLKQSNCKQVRKEKRKKRISHTENTLSYWEIKKKKNLEKTKTWVKPLLSYSGQTSQIITKHC